MKMVVREENFKGQALSTELGILYSVDAEMTAVLDQFILACSLPQPCRNSFNSNLCFSVSKFSHVDTQYNIVSGESAVGKSRYWFPTNILMMTV